MVEDLEEASNELIIADDDSVRFSVGETFVTVDNDDAETMLQAQLDEVGAEVTALEKEKKEITSAMADLKEKLYKKFGNAINLEE
jgi:prefoldin subunit 4|tara:strand:+ start:410 stop:664 length:255 start_codon:yes stop_codon:yes gene_type:complete